MNFVIVLSRRSIGNTGEIEPAQGASSAPARLRHFLRACGEFGGIARAVKNRCDPFGQSVKASMSAQPILAALGLDVLQFAAQQRQTEAIVAPGGSLRRKLAPEPIVVRRNL